MSCPPRGWTFGVVARKPPPPSGLGTPRGIRTPDLLLRRQLLYPAELLAHMSCTRSRRGAGDGNRTHVSSLEGWCSTIELHPHGHSLVSQKIIPQMVCGCQLFSYALIPDFSEITERRFCSGNKVPDGFFILPFILYDNTELPEGSRL